jgi:hypothetical protein
LPLFSPPFSRGPVAARLPAFGPLKRAQRVAQLVQPAVKKMLGAG